MLGELAEHGLMVAKDLAVRLRACEDASEAVALAEAFQKVSRVVRLTLALDSKLDRDAAREALALAREARKIEAEAALAQTPQAENVAPGPVQARKGRVRSLLNRLLWNETEGDYQEFEVLRDDLAARLDEAALSPDFETLPIETLARRVIADMDLSGELILSVCENPAPSPPEGEGVRRRPDG